MTSSFFHGSGCFLCVPSAGTLLEGSGINLRSFIINVPAPGGHNTNLHQEE